MAWGDKVAGSSTMHFLWLALLLKPIDSCGQGSLRGFIIPSDHYTGTPTVPFTRRLLHACVQYSAFAPGVLQGIALSAIAASAVKTPVGET